MSNNLFISYDLNSPGQNYADVIEKIKSLGSWAKVQQSYWYVDSVFSAQEATDKIKAVMDKNDSVIVVNSTDNSSAWYGLSDEVAAHIKKHWNLIKAY